MALFDVFVSRGQENWNVAALTSSAPVEGTVVFGVNAADAGTAGKEVSRVLGVPFSEQWVVWPSSQETIVPSPSEAT